MSHLNTTPTNQVSSPLRSNFSGAARPSTNPRIHALAKPYARPFSYSGSTTQPQSSGTEPLSNQRNSVSPTKQPAPSTRPSSNGGGLPRSGSESSLSAGYNMVKSLFSRPLGWLATPSRAVASNKRESSSSFSHDVEEFGESPSDRNGRQSKFYSTSSASNGDLSMYDPKHFSVTGRAITGTMLPPLPPNLTLSAKSQHPNEKPLPNRTNFSRPLTGSTSMPYLDPPSGLFSPSGKVASPRKSKLGMGTRLSRSSRLLDLGGQDADGDDEMSGPDARGHTGGERAGTKKDVESWSPWKEQAVRRTMTPVKKTQSRISEAREYTLPSLSPFRPPQSPHRQSTPVQSGLSRSATTVNLNRANSVASDVSMGRSGSKLRGSSTMLFNNNASGDRVDDRMSVDGERREDSALDWFMQDRWKTGGSPASLAASRRLGSAAPSTGMPPIRKGQMVWDAEKGFVRESELKASETPKPSHSNDAERILFALESLRKTPLASARKSTPFASSSEIPPELIGSSSRQLRKAVAVPLATAQAGENARRKRDKERLGGADSVMISPYGRRRQVDKAVRDERRQASEQASEYAPRSQSQTQSQSSDNRSRSKSMLSDDEMVSEREPSPSPAPTPRRSTRNKRPVSPLPEESTPKARKTRSGKSAKDKPQEKETTTPKATPRKGRKKTSPPPEKAPQEAAPAVPTITATAPSPGNPPESTYQPRAGSDTSRGSSSLRARNEPAHRRHQGAASYGNSRATSPNESSGRYSAREEDLPDMDELVQAKISLPPMSGFSFGGLAGTPLSTTAPPPVLVAPPVSPSKPVATLNVPARPLGNLNNRLSAGVSTRPRASSPLASSSIVATRSSPPSDAPKSTTPASTPAPPKPVSDFFAPPSGSTTPTTKPPSSLFAPQPNGDSSEPPKKAFSFGLGKPPAQEETSNGVPDFFGKKSAPVSGTTTPVIAPPAKPFNFGLTTKQDSEGEKKDAGSVIPSTFNFGSTTLAAPAPTPVPTTSTTNGSSFSFGKPAEAAPIPAAAPSTFAFGAKPADPPVPTAVPSTAPLFGAKPTEAAKPAFSFGTTVTKSPSPAPAMTFFGSSSNETTKSPPATASPFGGFSFGKPAETPKPVETVSAPAPASAPSVATPAPSTNGTFSFGSGAGFGAPKSAEPPKSFSFSNPTSPQPAATPSFGGFGSTTNGSSFGSTPATGNVAPSATTPAAPASTGFTFGATPSSSFGSKSATSTGFGAPAAGGFGAAPASNRFGAAAPASTSTNFGSTPASTGFGAPAPSSGFGGFGSGFGAAAAPTSTTAVSTPSTIATGSCNFGQPATSAPTFGGFGQPPAPQNNSTSFSFSTPPAAQPAQSGFTFGASPAPASTGFSFGAGSTTPAAAPRFGSPAPAPASPSVEAGGFSLGMGNAEAPGSPSGRKIKPLRRAGVKRN